MSRVKAAVDILRDIGNRSGEVSALHDDGIAEHGLR
jgi:hypothetical protein